MISPHLSGAHGDAYRAELRRQAERYRWARAAHAGRRNVLGAPLWRLLARRRPTDAPAAPIPLTGEGHGRVEAHRAA
jgi:hypothetical protein